MATRFTFDDDTIFDDGTSWLDDQGLAAADLVARAPLLGQPALPQKHVLVASSLSDMAPTLGGAFAGTPLPLPLPLPVVGDEVIYAWPGTLRGPAEADYWVEHPTQVTTGEDSETGLVEVIGGFSRLRAVVTWGITTPAQALAIEAHLSRLRGRRNGTPVPNFKYTTKLGTATGSWSVNGFHRADAELLRLTGAGVLAPGDWVHIAQIAGVPRAYRVLSYQIGMADTVTNGGIAVTNSGIPVTMATYGVAEVEPALHENISAGVAVAHLGDGSTTFISDTMELVSGVGPAMIFPALSYGAVNQRSAEFVSFRRSTVPVAVIEFVTNVGIVVTNVGVPVTETF